MQSQFAAAWFPYGTTCDIIINVKTYFRVINAGAFVIVGFGLLWAAGSEIIAADFDDLEAAKVFSFAIMSDNKGDCPDNEVKFGRLRGRPGRSFEDGHVQLFSQYHEQ